MMNNSGRSVIRYPFTASQWQELEHQTLFYKYMISGMPIPQELLFTIRRSLESSLSSNFIIHQPQIGWNGYHQMGYGKKIDPEPGRCRRTDGKKWRCSKEAYTDSKYCERHMHRGRNRSRKPVEVNNNVLLQKEATNSPPNAIIPNITKNTHSAPYFTTTSSRPDPGGISLSSQESSITNFNFLESNAYSHVLAQDYGNSCGNGMKGESNEHVFFSEANNSKNYGTMRNESCWQLEPLTMGSPTPLMSSQMKHNYYNTNSSGLQQFQSLNEKTQKYGHNYLNNIRIGRDDDDELKKVNMHHFLDDELPYKDNNKDSSWLNFSDDHKISSTQLSISIPPNSMHDFFMTQKW